MLHEGGVRRQPLHRMLASHPPTTTAGPRTPTPRSVGKNPDPSSGETPGRRTRAAASEPKTAQVGSGTGVAFGLNNLLLAHVLIVFSHLIRRRPPMPRPLTRLG